MLQLEVLIGELLAVDGLAAGAIATGEVTALKHELRDDTVEFGALVSKTLLASAESTEILSCLGDDVVEDLEVDATLLLLRFTDLGDVAPGVDLDLGPSPGDVKKASDNHVCVCYPAFPVVLSNRSKLSNNTVVP